MDLKILQRIHDKKRQLDKLRPLSQATLKSLRESLQLEWTYNSNAIEGNSLTLRETQLVLQFGITIKGKTFHEHLEAKNHEKAIFRVEQLAKPKYVLNEKDILMIHELILHGIEDNIAGRYRNGQVYILGANFIPPNPRKVSDLMEELVTWTTTNPEKLDLIVLLARMHHRFEWIHPFFDGNGRAGRLIMNLLFMKHGYPPAIILKNDRKKYYQALDEANKENYNPIVLLVAQALERSLDLYLSTSTEHADAEYLPLSTLSKQTKQSQEYLSLLARQGKIDAFKRGRIWFSSLESVKHYEETRERKRG